MGGRFWITGTDLGILMVECKGKKEAKEVLKRIFDKQFIGNYPTDKDKVVFNKWIKTAPMGAIVDNDKYLVNPLWKAKGE